MGLKCTDKLSLLLPAVCVADSLNLGSLARKAYAVHSEAAPDKPSPFKQFVQEGFDQGIKTLSLMLGVSPLFSMAPLFSKSVLQYQQSTLNPDPTSDISKQVGGLIADVMQSASIALIAKQAAALTAEGKALLHPDKCRQSLDMYFSGCF